jgi:hypothetical protein
MSCYIISCYIPGLMTIYGHETRYLSTLPEVDPASRVEASDHASGRYFATPADRGRMPPGSSANVDPADQIAPDVDIARHVGPRVYMCARKNEAAPVVFTVLRKLLTKM